MKNLIVYLFLIPSLAFGFAENPKATLLPPSQRQRSTARIHTSSLLSTSGGDKFHDKAGSRVNNVLSNSWILPATVFLTALPAEAAGGVVPSALWAYGHYLSILVITGCLIAERILVKPDMSVDDEDTIVKIDLVYGLMAALLIISGFARASKYGLGGDFYIHEILFWVKMTFAGIWGGLSIFPSLTFYQRNFARKNNEVVPPLSDKLAARLQQVINAEISAILIIPFLATLMSRGVWYWQDFPWQVGLVLSIAATGGSFFLYGRQALKWTEEDVAETVTDN